MGEQCAKSIRIFLIDGTPQSIITAEIINWTGHVLAAPRGKLIEIVKRPEVNRAGIYFLTGPDPKGSGETFVYIGESDNIGKRLAENNRDKRKRFWEKTHIVTAKDSNLTKAHIRFLESRVIAIASRSGVVRIVNDKSPTYESLPESDIVTMEQFIEDMQVILPVLGLEFMREVPVMAEQNVLKVSSSSVEAQNDSPIFKIDSRIVGVTATAREINGEFIVLAGSTCRISWEGQASHTYRSLHHVLIEHGKIVLPSEGAVGVFKENVIFSSPSAAAAVIFGRIANGRTSWRVQGDGRTYADWQNSQLPNPKSPEHD